MPVQFQGGPAQVCGPSNDMSNGTAPSGTIRPHENGPIPEAGTVSHEGAYTGPPRYSTVVQGHPCHFSALVGNQGQMKGSIHTRKEILPERYNMKMCWQSYFQTFHECALLNVWDRITAGQRLKLCLNTKAHELAQPVAGLPAIGLLDQIIELLNPVFSSLYEEGRAATQFDLGTKKESENYQDLLCTHSLTRHSQGSK